MTLCWEAFNHHWPQVGIIAAPGASMFIKPSEAKRLHVSARGELQSIKIDIKTLAYRLWFEKHASCTDVDWLLDGRLMDQLDELSIDQLLRVRDLLSRKTEDKGETMQLITFRSVIVPRTSFSRW